jgi:GNAT superfamily N-acetyltransferase
MMGEVLIRRVEERDFPQLGFVAPAAYAAAYHYLWEDPAELARHLETFSEAGFREFAARADAHLWLAEAEGMPLGFLSMLVGSPDPIEGTQGGAEIPRIFLLPNVRRQGIGRRLFAEAVQEGRSQGLGYLWLDAMDSADWALATYRSWGLAPIGTTVYPKPVLPQYSGMVVFRMDLEASREAPGVRAPGQPRRPAGG